MKKIKMQLANIRVSTIKKNEQRQVEAMKSIILKSGLLKRYQQRTQTAQSCKSYLEFAREGDVIHIHDFSRLVDIVEQLTAKGVALVSNGKVNAYNDRARNKRIRTAAGRSSYNQTAKKYKDARLFLFPILNRIIKNT